MSVVGLGGIANGLQAFTYPFPFRQFVILTSLGLLLVGINLISNPRRLIVNRFRVAGIVVSSGFVGLTASYPTAADWRYEAAMPPSYPTDYAMQASFIIIAAAFVLIVAASFFPPRRRLVAAAGILLMVGVSTFAVTQLLWGIWAAPADLAMTAAAVLVGLAALSFVHVLPRVRHLDVTHPAAESKDGRGDGTGTPTITYGRAHRET